MAFKLTEEVHNHIIDQAQELYPQQATGFLYGSGGKLKIVNHVLFIDNASSNPEANYRISEKDYLNAELYAVKNNLELLGVFNSSQKHFAVPTELDLQFAIPNFTYLKLSLFNRRVSDIKAWELNDFNMFEEKKLKLPEYDFNKNELQTA